MRTSRFLIRKYHYEKDLLHFFFYLAQLSAQTTIKSTYPFPTYDLESTSEIRIIFSHDLNESYLNDRVILKNHEGNVIEIDVRYVAALFITLLIGDVYT